MVEEKKATLDELLRLQESIDNGLVVVSKDQFETTEQALREKLDDYVGLMHNWEAQAAGFKARAKEFTSQAKTYENAVKNLKDRYKFLAKYYEQYELMGNIYKFSFSETESVIPTLADKDLTIEDKTNFYDYIDETTSYKWNKAAIKKALKEGKELGIAELKKDLKLVINPIPVSKKKKGK
jgi:archaellum component FlaC